MVGAIGIMPSTVDIAVSMIGWKGFLSLAGLAGGGLWSLAFMMTKISYSGYRFPSGDHPAGRLALCPFHLELLQGLGIRAARTSAIIAGGARRARSGKVVIERLLPTRKGQE
jgi:hypothetical protein